MVLINEGASARTVAVRVPAAAATAALDRLEAPSLTALGHVTLGGQTFGAATASVCRGPTSMPVAATVNGYVVRVPAASAAMLTIS